MGLDTYTGFLLILLLPLLYWHRRSRSTVRDVELSLFPLLESIKKKEEGPRGMRFRIPNGMRTALVTLCISCLALAYNGIHLETVSEEPGEWLIILDNSPSGQAEYKGHSVLDELKSRIGVLLRKIDDEDRFTLLVSSPEPFFTSNIEKADFLTRVAAVKNAEQVSDVSTLILITRILARDAKFKNIIVITPRSRQWRNASGGEAPLSWIPPDAEVLTGNVGITVIDVNPAGPDRFDLFLRTASSEMDLETLSVEVRSDRGDLQTFRIPVEADGSSELFLPGIFLDGGETRLALQVKDNLVTDNTGIVLNVPDREGEVSVWITGPMRPFMEAFFNSYPGYQLNRKGLDRNVSIFDSVSPSVDPPYPALVIFPVKPFYGFELKRIWAAPLITSFHPGHPAVEEALNFRQFRPAKILDYKIPGNFQVLGEAEGIPLVAAGTLNGKPLVVWFFDPADNGLYLDPAFPMLLNDTLLWLSGTDGIRTESGLCRTSLVPESQGKEMEGMDRFFQCTSLVHEAAWISLPDLERFPEKMRGTITQRKGLEETFLMIALLALLLLTVERTMQNGWRK